MLKRKKIVFLLSILSLFLLWQFYENKDVEIHVPLSNGEEHVFHMPRKEKRSLEYFLRYLVYWETAGYTLLGSKPMHMSCYLKPFSTRDWYIFWDSLCPSNLRILRGWNTFQKYQHLFLNNQIFAIWAEDNPFFGEGGPVASILLINKPLLAKMVDAHLEDFQIVLERETISSEELLLEAKTLPFLKTVLKCHNGLIGTLFGYGRDNAWLYEARDHGATVKLSCLWGDEIGEYFKKCYEASRSFSFTWLGNFPKETAEYQSYASFAVDPDSAETQALKRDFLKTREKIIEYYQDQDFLEGILRIFIEGSRCSEH